MRGLLLDVKNNICKEIYADTIDEYRKLIGCDTIDIVRRKIGQKKAYEIICDDNGAFENNPYISAINNFWDCMLIGNLIIFGLADYEGDLTSLTDVDIAFIKSKIMKLATKKHPEPYCMLTQCGY